MSDKKLSKENAQKQLNTLLEYYDLDLDDISDETVYKAIESSCNKLLKAIRKGRIEIKEENETINVYQHLKKPVSEGKTTIVYKEIDGRSKIAMKDNSETDYHGKIYSFLGGLSGEGADVIMVLKGVDISIAECLGALFLQV